MKQWVVLEGVHNNFSADGIGLPPYVVYKGKNI